MLEFFYDVGSPWTYLAFHKIEEVAAEAGVEVTWKPILVGGVFSAVNQGVYAARANASKLRAMSDPRSDELIARGGYGSPTIIVNGNDLYFGNDRLVLVREALRRR